MAIPPSMSERADPRMRGADPPKNPKYVACVGRPPHARGGRDGAGGAERHQRQTPACAGRTSGRLRLHRGHEADPRMRGADPVLYLIDPIHLSKKIDANMFIAIRAEPS